MFTMYDTNMQRIEYPAGFRPLDIFISAIEKERQTGRAEGSNRQIDYGFTHGSRDIELKFRLRANDTKDYRLIRDAAYRLFGRKFYVAEDYQPGKRYLVSVDERFIPDRPQGNQTYAEGSVKCTPLELPYAESIGTTLDLHREGASADAGLWGYGMGLIAEEGSTDYIHTGTGFRIYNAGDVEVHPFESYLRIVIDQAAGSTVDFVLSNYTTGDVFRYIEPLTGTLVLDGPKVTRNDAAALGKTNRQFISLAPGWNEFVVEGATSARVSFDFRFLYQ